MTSASESTPAIAPLSSPSVDRWLIAPCFAAAAVAIGTAVGVELTGNLHPIAIRWLTAALILLATGMLAPQPRKLADYAEGALAILLVLGLAFQMSQLFTKPPGMYLRLGPNWFVPVFEGLATAAVLAGAAITSSRPIRLALLVGLVCTHFYLGNWLIHTSPSPFIDVFMFQRDSTRALLSRVNPYGIDFPDIYGNSPFYGEGVVVNGRVTFGYPYFPLSLLLALPGQIFGDDYRYSQLIAMEGAACLMALASRERVGLLAAALFLFTPRFMFVLEQGWTEPFNVLAVAFVVFCAMRWRRGLPWALGLLFAVKQYMFFALPLSLLLFERPFRWKEIGMVWAKAIGLAFVITFPFFITQPAGFIRSVLVIQFLQPFRNEAMSFLAYIHSEGGPQLSSAWAFVAGFIGVGLALWRAPRTAAGFAAGMGLTYALFFAFNKQAFCNYYFFVIGTLCVAAATTRMPVPSARGP